MRLAKTNLILSFLLAFLALGAAAHAAPPGPKERIDGVYDEIKKATATAPDQDAMTAALTSTLDKLMDYEAFAQRTLKETWPKLDKAQRATFMEKFKQLVVQVYGRRFKPKTEFEISYRNGGEKLKEDGKHAKVYTTVKGAKVAADVDYSFALDGAGDKAVWLVYDFEIDQVSMALNWRKQFERIIASDGFDALIAKIDKRIGTDTDDEE
ncbi:MAG: ABC transporter substrate-binding protein [Myxococcales bacterium]|nr:ABC transporter substrate-binding protein [Myxococcales bacterium]MCB9735634.1 ABC transporter substrate-binding protein [Deltaproteobacteria bacterium]